ncbi:uncharacterized protein PAC_18580 [Phialocephala subalpina]|uniref:Uncharacterized protein n=1 Tax=Phialocephala subalpina TaxID=576137 RepID=A0A1L7XUH9_9HELO|nr:uncharacterized protein PAC_18580 [Phialocephala subalpina]
MPLPPPNRPKEDEDYKIREISGFKGTLRVDRDITLRTQLTRLLTLSHKASQSGAFNIFPPKEKSHELTQPTTGLRVIYFIAGYNTLVDTTVEEESQNSSRTAANIGIPVGEILAGGVPITGMGDATDLQASAERGTSTGRRKSWVASGRGF